MLHRSFPSHLKRAKYFVRERVAEVGLDPFEVIFEVLDYKSLNAVAAYQGFPTRYPHWRWGMDYNRLGKGYIYGLQTIYELVINNDPSYAYLLESNDMITQRMVMAHVYGHSDFFRNNMWFAHTNRKMMDEMANHASRIRTYMSRHGQDRVERFIDACLSLENLIDIHAPMTKPRGAAARRDERQRADGEPRPTGRLRAKSYMESFINPPDFIASQGREEARRARQAKGFPPSPERDVMRFLLEHAPLSPWQSAVLEMIREEALYFAPQAQTKIMNEGWASYWHSTLCTTGEVMGDAEIVDYAEKHAGVTATSGGRFNPYKLGIELFRDIEERWDMGRFGPDYAACDSFEERRRWNRHLGLGREKIFEVRRLYNDVTFIHEFLTADFCRRHNLFSFSYNASAEQYEIESREFPRIKERLLFSLTNAGNPTIDIVDANHKNRGELFLQHRYEGTELDLGKARATIANLQKLWGRPVHLASRDEKHSFVLSHDGKDVTLKDL